MGLERGHLVVGQLELERGYGVFDLKRLAGAHERGDDDEVVPQPRAHAGWPRSGSP